MADSKAQILIVEDDPLMARLYSKVFSIEGYEVAMAADGEEGLSAVHKNVPTIILLDVMMPKVNGLELLEKLKADPATKKIPVIMLTNLAGQADAEKAITLGAVKYIVKSEYEPKQIVNMVKEILAGYTRDQVPNASI
jgi:CheY-like chemotaxis protein